MSRKQILAEVWLNNLPLPEAVCGKFDEANPCHKDPARCSPPEAVWTGGFYRRLDNDKFEWIAFCNPLSKQYGITFNAQKFYNVLDAELPEKKPSKNTQLK